jgi:flagellar biosynthesis protein FliQ
MYGTPAVDGDRLQALVVEWGPRILAAIAILVIAHFVAKAVKWALAKGVNKLPGADQHNRRKGGEPERNATIGARLGDVGYWLVLLVGVIAALNVLGLEGVTEPLNAMLYQFGEFIPRIVGAVIIFFVGYVVATLAKRVVESALAAANIDHWLDKAGLRKLTGASGLAKTVGTIVFVLIIIPVAIAALNTLNIAAISGPATQVLEQVLNAVPKIITAAILLTIAYAVARWVASLIEQILPSFGFDSLVNGLFGTGTPAASPAVGASASAPPVTSYTAGADPATPAAAAQRAATTMTPSKVVANVVMVAILLFVAVQAAHVLQLGAIGDMLQEILTLFSRILFGGLIILAGVAIGQFLARMLSRGGGQSGQFASTIVRFAAIALATAMGLTFMGLANEIVILAFGLILGSGAVAAAVAFGVGGIQPARQLLDRMVNKAGQPPQ